MSQDLDIETLRALIRDELRAVIREELRAANDNRRKGPTKQRTREDFLATKARIEKLSSKWNK